MSSPFPFDAVIFDLDGTLVATDGFWIRAARAGAKKAFAELGLERELPLAGEWMSMVGYPLEQGFENVFQDLGAEQRALVMKRCVEEEERALKAGGAALLPDALAVLEKLSKAGVRLGIASNCGQFYLDSMLDSFSLRQWVEAPRCLDSPGITNKASMIADILERFETRSAVMVGDRASDRDAAWANGLPHVHLTSGFANEQVQCEAVIDGLVELWPLLEGRREWLLDCRRSLGENIRSIGVTGGPCSGKSLFARDLARLAPEPTVVIELDWFKREQPTSQAADEVLARVAQMYDLDRLEEELFEPLARGEAVQIARARGETSVAIASGAAWILEGPCLLHPRIASRLDRVAALEVSAEVALRRCSGRDSMGFGPAPLMELRSERLPLHEAFERDFPAEERADWYSAADPFGQTLPEPGPIE